MGNGKKYKGLYIMHDRLFDHVYAKPECDEIESVVDIYAPQLNRETLARDMSILKDLEVLFAGWGGPVLNDEFLSAAPNLKVAFYACGSIRGYLDRGQVFEHGIRISSGRLANAIPVAEFCLSQILFSLKLGWHFAIEAKRDKAWPEYSARHISPGAYDSTVGIISLGAISEKLIKLLRPFNINVLVSSGHLTEGQAKSRGFTLASVEEIFQNSDVVSLHSPGRHCGVIGKEHFLMMKQRATFLNTARGIVVRENEMIEALKERPDIMALLDVTDPEPPVPGSEIFELPNIITFPHISGSKDGECRRMARYAIDEFYRFSKGQELKYGVDKNNWQNFA